MEQWKDIDAYEGMYQVSSHGRVRSLDRKDHRGRFWKGRILKQVKIKSGYYQVTLLKIGKQKQIGVHRLVALAFVPNENKPKIINHKDGNKTNNFASNLEWVTVSENTKHAYDMDLINKGEKHHKAKLQNEQVIEIKKRIQQGECYASMAREFGVDRSVISAIKIGRIWTHIVL